MLCPACQSSDNKVIDSRLTEGGKAIRRRRVCQSCQRRFTTKERVEEELRITVIKSNGQRVPYNRDNILRGVERATTKLNVTEVQLQQLVDQVEEAIFAHHDREVRSVDIGQYVAQMLRRLNPVAYVRFMSVYRKFATIDEFVDEISEVRQRAAHDNPLQQSLF
jgi:transcriptional repressor NrdR